MRRADIGCGAGQVTAHLHKLGVDALSPGMIATARRDHPGLRFEVGSMTELDLPAAELKTQGRFRMGARSRDQRAELIWWIQCRVVADFRTFVERCWGRRGTWPPIRDRNG